MNNYSGKHVKELILKRRMAKKDTFKFLSFYPYQATKKIEEVTIDNQKLEMDVNDFLSKYYEDMKNMDTTQGWGFLSHTSSHNFINFVSDFINYDCPEQVEYESEEEY